MPQTISNSFLLAVLLGAGFVFPAAAQKYTPEPPPLTTGPCKPTKKAPCPTPEAAPTAAPANPFPFPGEEPKPSSDTPAAPGAFPFPGEPAADAPTPASSTSSSSSSSDSDPDPDKPALKDEGSTGSTRFARKKLPKVSAVDPDEREAKDIEISRYYYSTGNFEAAYLRAKDATVTIPDDPAAHLALAQAAARVGKPDEAAAAYATVLKLDSSDQQIKAARKALAEIASAKPVKQAVK